MPSFLPMFWIHCEAVHSACCGSFFIPCAMLGITCPPTSVKMGSRTCPERGWALVAPKMVVHIINVHSRPGINIFLAFRVFCLQCLFTRRMCSRAGARRCMASCPLGCPQTISGSWTSPVFWVKRKKCSGLNGFSVGNPLLWTSMLNWLHPGMSVTKSFPMLADLAAFGCRLAKWERTTFSC